jgi:nitroreductase
VDVFEAIRTTRAMRRLDPARAVTDADLVAILEAASRGPSGGNLQPVRWLAVRDKELKRRVGEVYREQAHRFLRRLTEKTPDIRSYYHLADHLGEAPVLVVPCAAGDPARLPASVYPAVQNLMLAARALGLGTTLTTIHRGNEAAVKEILGIPDPVHTFAIIPVGHPLGHWREAPRRPLAELAYGDLWGQPLGVRPKGGPLDSTIPTLRGGSRRRGAEGAQQ